MTWNINRRNNDHAFRYALEDEKAEIISFQECFHPLTYLSEREMARLENHFSWKPTRNGWGNCVVTPKTKLVEIAVEHEFKGRLLIVKTRIPKIGEITISNLHVPITDGYSRINLLKMLELIAKNTKKGNAVICGDFNFGECFDKNGQTEHRDIYRKLLDEFEIVDCYRKFHETFGQTFRPSRKAKTIFGLDYILATHGLANRLESCRILGARRIEEMSDHNPIVAIFK